MVWPNLPNDRVHGVVGAARVDGQPANTAGLDPVGKLAGRARVFDEITRLVWLDWPTLGGPVGRIEAVVAGMNDQDVTALDGDARLLLPTLEVRWAVDLIIAHTHLLQVDHAFGAGDEVVRRVEVRANMQG